MSINITGSVTSIGIKGSVTRVGIKGSVTSVGIKGSVTSVGIKGSVTSVNISGVCDLPQQLYSRNILALNPLSYWPLNEASGLVAADASGHGRNAAYRNAGVTYAQAGFPNGDKSVLVNAATPGNINLYSVSLRTAWNGSEGSIVFSYRASDVGVWTDTLQRYWLYAYTDGNNKIEVYRPATSGGNNRWLARYTAGGVQFSVLIPINGVTDWITLGLTWSKTGDYFRVYYNGVELGADSKGLASWVGQLTSNRPVLGSANYNDAGINGANGYLSNCAIWDRPLTDAEMLIIGRAAPETPTVYPGFTIVMMPDTQSYVIDPASTWMMPCQTQWIADNKTAYSIKGVMHDGDVVETVGTAAEWTRADAAIDILDAASVPYLISAGNHDFDDFANHIATTFNGTFPQSRFTNQPGWAGGFYQAGHSEDAYNIITYAGASYLLVVLSEAPDAPRLTWFDGLLTTHADKDCILVTHRYLETDNTRNASGDAIWAVIKTHNNVIFVDCGHVVGDGIGYRVDSSDGGRPCYQVLANYQVDRDANMPLVTFDRAGGIIHMQTFTPAFRKLKHTSETAFDVVWTAHI